MRRNWRGTGRWWLLRQGDVVSGGVSAGAVFVAADNPVREFGGVLGVAGWVGGYFDAVAFDEAAEGGAGSLGCLGI